MLKNTLHSLVITSRWFATSRQGPPTSVKRVYLVRVISQVGVGILQQLQHNNNDDDDDDDDADDDGDADDDDDDDDGDNNNNNNNNNNKNCTKVRWINSHWPGGCR